MQLPITLEPYDGTVGFVVIGHEETRLVAEHCFSDGRVPFMGTNARHPKYVPMLYVSDTELGSVLRILINRGHCVTFKGRKRARGTTNA
jgi:hypothetical protein